MANEGTLHLDHMYKYNGCYPCCYSWSCWSSGRASSSIYILGYSGKWLTEPETRQFNHILLWRWRAYCRVCKCSMFCSKRHLSRSLTLVCKCGMLRHSGIISHVMIICDASYHVVDHLSQTFQQYQRQRYKSLGTRLTRLTLTMGRF